MRRMKRTKLNLSSRRETGFLQLTYTNHRSTFEPRPPSLSDLLKLSSEIANQPDRTRARPTLEKVSPTTFETLMMCSPRSLLTFYQTPNPGTTQSNSSRERSLLAARCIPCRLRNKRSQMSLSKKIWSQDVSDP